jgi:pSer/pThr/pTyr-binding forkhead associated (FHA) protein
MSTTDMFPAVNAAQVAAAQVAATAAPVAAPASAAAPAPVAAPAPAPVAPASFAPSPPPAAPIAPSVPSPQPSPVVATPFAPSSVPAISPPQQQPGRTDSSASPDASVARVVTILKDGSEGQVYRITGASTDIGRSEGNILLADDPYLSPRHARISLRDGQYYLRDLGSVNGVFFKLRESVALGNGDVVLLGQQLLRVEILSEHETSFGPVSHYGVMLFGTPEQPRIARLVQLTTEGIPRDVYHLFREETVVGRESGDLVFTDDAFLSRRHATFRVDRANRRVILSDLGSSNGTLVQFRGERELQNGDVFRLGHHLFRVDLPGRARAGGAAPR